MIVIFPVQPLKFMTGTAENERLGAVTVDVERPFSLSEAMLSLPGTFGSSNRTVFGAFICGVVQNV